MVDQEEQQIMKDRKYLLVKEIFFGDLAQRNDLKIPREEAEETFLALWIFLMKKNKNAFAITSNIKNRETATDFYFLNVKENQETKNYLTKLLISFNRAN